MMRQGLWSARKKFVRCTGERKCNACQQFPDSFPHGPYTILRRRKPLSKGYDQLYLGIVPLSADLLALINNEFGGREKEMPEKQRVLEFVNEQKNVSR